ncbi:hypothetical protein B0T24DRAFT_598177 [Lasiosphaeria ovina]|uniref:Uncharacterized protein n=1 Tax=Lasiosphaeria ovina TaxID=92902 RepID=A0AAE0JVH9_9PEZI|nr:hypothetical protein B0T24DRAFT_598177 [Lasiosphaeria ovina]
MPSYSKPPSWPSVSPPASTTGGTDRSSSTSAVPETLASGPIDLENQDQPENAFAATFTCELRMLARGRLSGNIDSCCQSVRKIVKVVEVCGDGVPGGCAFRGMKPYTGRHAAVPVCARGPACMLCKGGMLGTRSARVMFDDVPTRCCEAACLRAGSWYAAAAVGRYARDRRLYLPGLGAIWRIVVDVPHRLRAGESFVPSAGQLRGNGERGATAYREGKLWRSVVAALLRARCCLMYSPWRHVRDWLGAIDIDDVVSLRAGLVAAVRLVVGVDQHP